jgi:hypothetical protein
VTKPTNSRLTLILTLGFILSGIQALKAMEIDLSDQGTTASTPTSSQNTTTQPAPTATPASKTIQIEDNTDQPATQAAPTPTAEVTEVHGVVKMKDKYEAGIKYYQAKDYGMARQYLLEAVKQTNDPYTPKYIYAEANAMLGVIYQYHIIHKGFAYYYYKQALKYEPGNKTARRHIKQVYKYRNQKD